MWNVWGRREAYMGFLWGKQSKSLLGRHSSRWGIILNESEINMMG
jgi:hypothetical protein